MSKGEQTREMILQRSAQVFNRRGYFGASMSDIMEATGLEKGGIYNYFQSKDDLALQAFEYSIDLYRQEFASAIKGKFDAIDRLNGIVDVFYGMVKDYPLPGGCPVMNRALEADDAHPVLRERARDAMQEWYDFIKRIVQRGIEREQIRGDVDADEVASIIYSMLEGGVMLTRLTGEMVHLDRVVGHMSQYLESSLRAEETQAAG